MMALKLTPTRQRTLPEELKLRACPPGPSVEFRPSASTACRHADQAFVSGRQKVVNFERSTGSPAVNGPDAAEFRAALLY